MKKIDIKKIITGALMAVMVLIQALITSVPVYASETSSIVDWWKDITSKSIHTSEVFVYFNTYDNKYYNTSFAYFKTSAPVYAIVFTHPISTYYAYDIVLLSEEPFTYKYRHSNDNYDKFDKDSYIEKALSSDSHDSVKADFMGKTYYTGGISTTGDKGFKGSVLYDITGIQNCYGISQILPYIYQKGGKFDYVSGLPITDTDSQFYLKNLGYTVTAEDSSEHPDETFIHFTWDTDNLQEGDLLEIKTRNYYTKFGGDKIIGFNDYITADDSVSAFSGKYDMSQTDAVKKWFSTVENKPLAFKDYDTDMYFLRPVRGNVGGMWVRVTMGRKTPTSSPYIKDVEYGDLSEDGDWTKNEDITSSEGGNHGFNQKGDVIAPGLSNPDGGTVDINSIWDLFKYLWSQLNTLVGYFGQLPQLINQVIGWLPSPVIVLICGSIILVIILRIFGR